MPLSGSRAARPKASEPIIGHEHDNVQRTTAMTKLGTAVITGDDNEIGLATTRLFVAEGVFLMF